MHGKLADVQRCAGDDVEPDPAKADATDTGSTLLLLGIERGRRCRTHDYNGCALGRERGT